MLTQLAAKIFPTNNKHKTHIADGIKQNCKKHFEEKLSELFKGISQILEQ